MLATWIIVPLIGVLWYLNLTLFLKNAIKGKSTHNQTLIGAVLTYMLIVELYYGLTFLLP